jgi:hypothetical protein
MSQDQMQGVEDEVCASDRVRRLVWWKREPSSPLYSIVPEMGGGKG